MTQEDRGLQRALRLTRMDVRDIVAALRRGDTAVAHESARLLEKESYGYGITGHFGEAPMPEGWESGADALLLRAGSLLLQEGALAAEDHVSRWAAGLREAGALL